MSTEKFQTFRDLRKGKYDWNIKVRIMHLWRGYTTSGEPFKWFNILLIDTKIHAYVPETIADVMESQMVVGNMYLFKNFTLKEYKPTDRFRCIHKDIQIIFSSDTKAIPLDDNDVIIEKVMFDFYDLSDLKQLSRQTTYLTDRVNISNVAATTYYLNYDHYSVTHMRNILKCCVK